MTFPRLWRFTSAARRFAWSSNFRTWALAQRNLRPSSWLTDGFNPWEQVWVYLSMSSFPSLSLFLSIFLSVCLLPISLSLYLSPSLFLFYLYLFLYLYLYLYLSINLSLSLSLCPPIFLSIYLKGSNYSRLPSKVEVDNIKNGAWTSKSGPNMWWFIPF